MPGGAAHAVTGRARRGQAVRRPAQGYVGIHSSKYGVQGNRQGLIEQHWAPINLFSCSLLTQTRCKSSHTLISFLRARQGSRRPYDLRHKLGIEPQRFHPFWCAGKPAPAGLFSKAGLLQAFLTAPRPEVALQPLKVQECWDRRTNLGQARVGCRVQRVSTGFCQSDLQHVLISSQRYITHICADTFCSKFGPRRANTDPSVWCCGSSSAPFSQVKNLFESSWRRWAGFMLLLGGLPMKSKGCNS